jgi:hypothetical protein
MYLGESDVASMKLTREAEWNIEPITIMLRNEVPIEIPSSMRKSDTFDNPNQSDQEEEEEIRSKR